MAGRKGWVAMLDNLFTPSFPFRDDDVLANVHHWNWTLNTSSAAPAGPSVASIAILCRMTQQGVWYFNKSHQWTSMFRFCYSLGSLENKYGWPRKDTIEAIERTAGRIVIERPTNKISMILWYWIERNGSINLCSSRTSTFFIYDLPFAYFTVLK